MAEGEPKIVVEVLDGVVYRPNNEVEVHSTVGASSNISNDELRELAAEVKGVSPDDVVINDERNRRARRRGRVGFGYTGRWNSNYDPKAN